MKEIQLFSMVFTSFFLAENLNFTYSFSNVEDGKLIKYIGIFGAIWEYLEIFGNIWEYLGLVKKNT